MKAYLAIKYKEDHSNKELVEQLTQAFKKIGVDTYVMARDYEKWGELQNVHADVLMAHTFKVIDQCDFVAIEFSEKGVGLGIEAGYAYAKRKPVVIIAQEGSEISTTLRGLGKRIVVYKDLDDLDIQLAKLDLQSRGVCFIIMRPDNTFLLQQRDGNSKRFKHMWCFPGGSCEGKEEYLDTVVREVYEEYELKINKEQCEFLVSRTMNQSHVFICKIDPDQQPILREGEDMKWMSMDEVKKLTIGFNQGDIVEKLEEYLKNNKTH